MTRSTRHQGAALVALATALALSNAMAQPLAGKPRLMVQAGHSGGLAVLQSISPDGRLVATADNLSIKIWNSDIGRLVCELKAEPRGTAAEKADGPGMAGSSYSLAWAADGLSLYVPSEKRSLTRYDLSRCAKAETVTVRMPDPRTHPRRHGDPAQVDNDIEEVSTLKDGQILARTPSGLYAIRIQGQQGEAMLLASLQTPEPEMPEMNLADLFSPERRQQMLGQLLGSLSAKAMGAHSADGRVVVLTAQSVSLGPFIIPLASDDTVLVSGGQQLPLSGFQGAAASYKGVSVAAVSASGRWLAVRSAAPGGALISLFDVASRKLLKAVTITASGGAQMSAGPLTSQLQPAYEQAKAVVGLTFSPDEKRLLILRPRTLAKGESPDDPTLEIRRVDDFSKVERQVGLRGVVVPQADGVVSMNSMRGNALAPSANQAGFVFQNASFSRGATMAAGQWKKPESPELTSWAATEGAVTSLSFSDAKHLQATQLVLRNETAAPTVQKKGQEPQLADMAMGMLTQGQQVVSWDFDIGGAQRAYAGRVATNTGRNTLADPANDRLLRIDQRIESQQKLTQELVMQSMRNPQELWRRGFSEPAEGFAQKPESVAWSADRKLVAVVLHRDQTPGGPPSAAQGKPAAPAPAAPPPSNEKKNEGFLGGLMGGGLADRLKQLLPGQDRDAAVPTNKGRASDATAWQLQLLDAQNGQVLASIGLSGKPDLSNPLTFVASDKLMVGNTLMDLQQLGGSWTLKEKRGKALNGKLVGMTPTTGRPILASGSADSSLRGIVLPAGAASASLANASADDRWIAVLADGAVQVYDSNRLGKPLYSANLEGDTATAMALSPNGRHLAVGTAQGAIKLFDVPAERQVATLLALSDGGWTVADPDGRLDSSNLGDNPALHWVMSDAPLQPLPFDALMRAYHTPYLLPWLIDGDAALDSVPDLAGRNRALPLVSIDQVTPVTGKPDRVQVKVTVASQTDTRGAKSGAMDLRLLRNGRLVGFAPSVDGPLEADPKTGRYTQVFNDVRLPEGDGTTQFTAYAFNTDRLRSKVATLTYKPPRAVKAASPRAYVLAIGVNAYDDSAFSPLQFAVNDARLIVERVSAGLRNAGGYSEVVGVTLESTPGGRNDAVKERIQAALGVLSGRADTARVLAGVPQADRLAPATPSDLVIIAFAGHGYVSNATKDLHLVPADVTGNPGQEGLARFDARSISAAELDHWLRGVDAGQLALVIDACHSAAAVTADFKAGPMGSRGLGQLASDKGARILAATQAADGALEHKSLKHGLLTYALVEEGLATGEADARPSDGRIDLIEWLRYPRERLPALQAELQGGGLSVKVQGEAPTATRGASRPSTGATREPRLQRPALFDFLPPGNAVPTLGMVKKP